MRFLTPLAHVICASNKSRAVGFLTTDNFEPGKTPDPDTWFMPADFGDDTAREAQADFLDGINVASIFLRFESGHSNDVSIQHCPFFFPRTFFGSEGSGTPWLLWAVFILARPPVCLGAFRGNFASCSGHKSKPRDPFRVRGGTPLGRTGLVPRHH